MNLAPRAVAVAGVGYGPRLFAVEGFSPVVVAGALAWDTAQGVAGRFHKFTPIHDAEAIAEAVSVGVGYAALCEAVASAACSPAGWGVASGSERAWGQAKAQVECQGWGAGGGCDALAEVSASAYFEALGVGSACGWAQPTTSAGANAQAKEAGVCSSAAVAGSATGVLNPSDEELVLMVRRSLKRVRAKSLTPTRISL